MSIILTCSDHNLRYVGTVLGLKSFRKYRTSCGIKIANNCKENVAKLKRVWKRSSAWCRTIILPVVLYGCETWSLTLRDEHRLRVFENRVFRRIFGPKRDWVTGEWRKLHNEELNDLYCSPSTVRLTKSGRMRWAEHVARMEEGRGVHKVLVGKPEGKRQLGRLRRRWEDNIKMDLEEVGRGCGAWIELAQDRDRWRVLVSTVMNFRVVP